MDEVLQIALEEQLPELKEETPEALGEPPCFQPRSISLSRALISSSQTTVEHEKAEPI